MVLSKLNTEISYPEFKAVDPADIKMESVLYQTELFLTPKEPLEVILSVGMPKHTYKTQNIVFFPIYLVKRNHKVVQIGVYEVNATSYLRDSRYRDEEGDLVLERMNDPLLYAFATPAFLRQNRLEPADPLSPNSPKGKSDNSDNSDKDLFDKDNKNDKKGKRTSDDHLDMFEGRADIFIQIKGVPLPPSLPEETAKEAKHLRESFRASDKTVWINQCMQNKYYSLQDNEGGGDCLFATIRDAFSSIGQQTSVAKLRKKLSEEATDEVFYNYKEQYDMMSASFVKDTKQLQELASNYAMLKERIKSLLDRDQQVQLVEQAKQVKAQHDQLLREKKVTASLLGEYRFMKNVTDLDQFKRKIRHCDFWADTWAISTLERILNIKLVLLSSESYKNGDQKNVLLCGQLNDKVLEQRGLFQPDYYVVVDYTGNHYKLIGYRHKLIFRYRELPYDLKHLVYDKCMEKNAGPFAIIPEFQTFASQHSSQHSSSSSSSQHSSSSITKGFIKDPRKEETQYEDLTESKLRGLYNDDIVFQFYAKSLDKPLPGKGSGEKIPSERMREYSTLATIPQWRKKLSMFWVQPFSVDNHQWATVEHYTQAVKFKKGFPTFYLSFSLDSGTELSKDPLLAKAAGSKTGKLDGKWLRPLEVTIDVDMNEKRERRELYVAQYAKFTQNNDLKQLLLATQEAKLVQYVKGYAPVVADELMLVRSKLA